jgi:predicted Zn-dependent peptidase
MNEIISRIEAISPEDVMRVAEEFFQQDSIAVTVLGNLNGLKLSKSLFDC